MRDVLLLLYCAAIGFAAAGIAASFYRMVTSEPARFSLLGRGWLGLVSTFLFFAVSGPAILADMAIRHRKAARDARGLVAAGIAVAALWSLCSGILVLGLFVAVQEQLA